MAEFCFSPWVLQGFLTPASQGPPGPGGTVGSEQAEASRWEASTTRVESLTQEWALPSSQLSDCPALIPLPAPPPRAHECNLLCAPVSLPPRVGAEASVQFSV